MQAPPFVIIAAAAVALLLLAANRRRDLAALVVDDGAPVELGDDGAEQAQAAPGAVESTLAALDLGSYMPTFTDADTEAANLAAFLRAIRWAEGTAGPNGYRTMFGGRLFDSYADHPRAPRQFTDKAGRTLWTSAAGAYQFMAVSPIPGGGSTKVDTWDRLQRKLGLPDFSPESQDAAAVELVRQAGALADVKAGRFEAAIAKVRGTWASLPGAGYAQPERSMGALLAQYINAGGSAA